MLPGTGNMESKTSESAKKITLEINVQLQGVKEKEETPKTFVYLFDSRGLMLSSAPIEKDKISITLPSEYMDRTVRVFLGPEVREVQQLTISKLSRLNAYEKRVHLTVGNTKVNTSIVDAVWRCWFYCSCVVRGRLVKRLTLPDGTIKELPVCHSRVIICEVDPSAENYSSVYLMKKYFAYVTIYMIL